MPEQNTNITNNDEPVAPVQRGCIDDDTCACGEKHQHQNGHVSRRESCTSPLKFGNSCCCETSGDTPKAHHSCGHGPRCQ